MPRPRKPAGTTQPRSRRTNRSLELVRPPFDKGGTPRCPSGLLESSRHLWNAYWSSQVAAAVEEVDHTLVERWIEARDQWRRATNITKHEPMVTGSTGQPVANPMFAVAASREAAMLAIEKQLGIGPKAKADLGLTAAKGRLTAAELNKMAAADEPDEELDAEEAELLGEFGEEAT